MPLISSTVATLSKPHGLEPVGSRLVPALTSPGSNFDCQRRRREDEQAWDEQSPWDGPAAERLEVFGAATLPSGIGDLTTSAERGREDRS